MKIVYIAGTFDLFHVGHVRLFKRAAELGLVVAAVNTDAFAERYKRRPLIPLDDRKEMVASCRYVAGVLTNWGEEDSRPTIMQVQPDYIVHGDDWDRESFMDVMGLTEEFLEEQEIEIVSLSYTPGVSTSTIIERSAPYW